MALYDYIIIGAGSAGCVLADRLGHDQRLSVLVLEAGAPDSSFLLKMPAGFFGLSPTRPYNWRYQTPPQGHCDNRRTASPRGKPLGGSPAINALAHVTGQ